MGQQKPTGTAARGLSVLRKWRIWRSQGLKGGGRCGESTNHFRHGYQFFWETRGEYKVILWPGSMGLERWLSEQPAKSAVDIAQDAKSTVGSVDIWAAKRHGGNHGRNSLRIVLNLWHKLLPQMSLDAIDKYLQPGKTDFFSKKNPIFPPLLVLQLLLGGRGSTGTQTSAGTMGGNNSA